MCINTKKKNIHDKKMQKLIFGWKCEIIIVFSCLTSSKGWGVTLCLQLNNFYNSYCKKIIITF